MQLISSGHELESVCDRVRVLIAPVDQAAIAVPISEANKLAVTAKLCDWVSSRPAIDAHSQCLLTVLKVITRTRTHLDHYFSSGVSECVPSCSSF